MTLKVGMNQNVNKPDEEEQKQYLDSLDCCFGGYETMLESSKMRMRGFGSNASSIFDCTCFRPSNSALLSKG